jgi:predicted nuclease with TOPRIM domain
MNHFNSIREQLNTLNRDNKLIAEMFEKRKSPAYRYEHTMELLEDIELSIIITVNHNSERS